MPTGVQEAAVDISTSEMSTKPCDKEGQPQSSMSENDNKPDEQREEQNCEDSVQDANVDGSNEDQGVEVVLGTKTSHASESTNEKPDQTAPIDQNVFRTHHHAPMRPRMMRPPSGPYPFPYSSHGSGSWGYGPPPPHPHYNHAYSEYPAPPSRVYPHPPCAPSGSFDDHSAYRQHPHHHRMAYYSPQGQYPPPTRRYGQEVNVISPNHGHSLTPRPRSMQSSPASTPHSHYRYPPSSPVRHPTGPSASHRLQDYAVSRRGKDDTIQGAQSSYSRTSEDWGARAPAVTKSASAETCRQQPSMVADPSFESHPTTPGGALPLPDPQYQFYGAPSWGSFDASLAPPPQFDGYNYGPPPESPYSPYGMPPPPPSYNPNMYYTESFPPPVQYGPNGSFSYSYDEEDRMMGTGGRDFGANRQSSNSNKVTPTTTKTKKSKSGNSGTAAARELLPKAAEEIDFDVASPPMEPIEPEGTDPVCTSLSEVNGFDVLCGRGGGTNSQIGNRRFRKLVQDFQPIYLLARRKEKPLLARTIVLIIRKRGGRFLKKDDETGELYEVGDVKAEAKTSQALREGLDVRATKSAASSLLEKKKKKKEVEGYGADDLASPMSVDKDDNYSPIPTSRSPADSPKATASSMTSQPESPPPLPRLVVEDVKSVSGVVHPHSPDQLEYRKRRRMRVTAPSDRFFPEFCPPRADLPARAPSPVNGSPRAWDMACGPYGPLRRSPSHDDDIRYHAPDDDATMGDVGARGCAGVAFDMVKDAAASSFACLGPATWRR